MDSFATQLRHWRGHRHLSQLALASEAQVSARHISFLESGRARPSREMILKLADTLNVPRPEQNRMLESVGFAAHYPLGDIDADQFRHIRAAMERMMDRHDPYPAILLDRVWRLRRMNRSAAALFGMVGLTEGDDLLAVLAEPGAGAALVENWPEAGHHLVTRLRAESRAAGGIHQLDQAAAKLMHDPEIASYRAPVVAQPLMATVYIGGGMRLSLFSTIAQFSGAEDLALSDLKLELMFPADQEADATLETLGRQ